MIWQEILTTIIVIMAAAGVLRELRKTFSSNPAGCGTCSSCPSASNSKEATLINLEVPVVNGPINQD